MNRVQNQPLTSLPFSEEEVNAYTLDALAELVIQVKQDGQLLQERAPYQVNGFLALAAVKLAEEYVKKVIQGPGYADQKDHDGGNF